MHSGYRALSAISNWKVSTLLWPLSTKSPCYKKSIELAPHSDTSISGIYHSMQVLNSNDNKKLRSTEYLRQTLSSRQDFLLTYQSHHEDIACVRHLAPHVEQLQQVVELPVDVPAYFYRRSYELDVVLFHQDFLHLEHPHPKKRTVTEQCFYFSLVKKH